MKPGMLRDFIGIIEAAIGETREFDGCHKVDIWTSQDASKIWLVQTWESRMHQAKCRAWRDGTGMYDMVAAYLTGPVSFTWLDLIEVHPAGAASEPRVMVVTLAVKPEVFSDFEDIVRGSVSQVLDSHGCHKVEFWASRDSHRLVMIQAWESRAHQEQYRAWREGTGAYGMIAAYLTEPISFAWFDLPGDCEEPSVDDMLVDYLA